MPQRSSRVTSLLVLLGFLVLAILVFRGFGLAPTTNTLARGHGEASFFLWVLRGSDPHLVIETTRLAQRHPPVAVFLTAMWRMRPSTP